jgi:esterase/lipase superfamily enzyme
MFKRLWQTGCDMKFVGVTWFGEEGVLEAFHYQENVRNALLSGESFAALMSHYSQDKTVVMAHSLGNMVVSSALQF